MTKQEYRIQNKVGIQFLQEPHTGSVKLGADSKKLHVLYESI